MIKRALRMIALTGIGMIAAGNAAAVNVEKAIEGRQGLMQVYAFNMSMVSEMAKGNTEYDAETAQNAANNLLAAASMKNGPMWPEGSGNDNKEFGDITKALPEIWTTYPEIGQRGANLIEALESLKMVAGTGLDALRKGVKPVGQACKGCHDDFRAE